MDDDDVIVCGECGATGGLDDFDVGGANPDCLICQQCHTEIQASTGIPLSTIVASSIDILSPQFFAVADSLLRRKPI